MTKLRLAALTSSLLCLSAFTACEGGVSLWPPWAQGITGTIDYTGDGGSTGGTYCDDAEAAIEQCPQYTGDTAFQNCSPQVDAIARCYYESSAGICTAYFDPAMLTPTESDELTTCLAGT